MHASVAQRQEYLITVNIAWLRQADALLTRINDGVYAASPSGLAPHKAGAHLRHILEFYECFLAGLAGGRIDYDARKRDLSVETSRQAARARIRLLTHRLETEPALRIDSLVSVLMEDSTGSRLPEPYLVSSVGRELQVLSSHTIHHFALMAMTLRALEVPMDPDFGLAPSTLRYRASLAAPDAARCAPSVGSIKAPVISCSVIGTRSIRAGSRPNPSC